MTLLLTFLCTATLLIAPLYIVYKPPHLLIRYFAHRWPDVLWHIPLPTPRRLVTLTIDDAPSIHTPELMRTLAANNATATFFVIGSQVPGREDMLADLVRSGHELGNHAMHDKPSRSLSTAELLKQIEIVQGYIADAYAIANVTQPAQRFFRPGSGFFSTRMRQAIAKLPAYQIVLGGIYPHDPQIPYAWLNARHILSMVRPGGIVICHDRRAWTVPMLRRVLPELRARGYEVVSLSRLLTHGNSTAETVLT